MAPKGNKRTAAPVASRARKVAKLTQQEEQLQAVEKAIEDTTGLPSSCRSMLLALLPSSLGASADARHPLQAHAVGLIAEALAQARSEKEAAAGAAAGRAAEAQAKQSELEAEKARAEGALELKAERAREEKAGLESALSGQAAAKAALDAARQTEQGARDAEAAKRDECRAFDDALAEHLAALRDGAWDEGAATGHQHIVALEPALHKAELDSSVLASLRIAGSKRRADRTNFDSMVLEQVGVSLSEKAAKLQAELAERGPAVAQRAAEVAAKQADVESTETKVQECKSAFEQAQAEQRTGEEARAAAARVLESFLLGESGAASEAKDCAQAELDLFLQGPLGAFEALRIATPKAAEGIAEAGEGVSAPAPTGGA